jgi:hypothetical protein
MSLLPSKTHRTPNDALFAPYSVVGEVSTLQSQISSIGQADPNPSFSTITVNNGYIGLGGTDELSTIGGDLYFNNQLLALVNNLSSIGDWSIYPAISSIDMAGFDINDADNIACVTAVATTVDTTNLSTVNANVTNLAVQNLSTTTALTSTLATNNVKTSTLTAEVGIIDNFEATTGIADLMTANNMIASTITASTINVTNLAFISTYAYVSTISSLQFEGDKGDIDEMIVSSITGNTADFDAMTISSINGSVYPPVIPPPFTLPNDIVCSTLTANNGISSLGGFYVGSLGGNVRMGGIPDTLNQITSFAQSQTHGSASLGYTINSFGGGDLTLNSSNDCLINVDSDFTVTAGDVNLTQTDATSIFNVTATGAGVMAFGLGLDITTGAALLINSGGNVSIGSGNVLGADTEIEKVAFKENEIYKAGADDLEIRDVSSINGFQYVPTQQWASQTASQAVNLNNNNLSNANVIQAQNISSIQGTVSSLRGDQAIFSTIVALDELVFGQATGVLVSTASLLADTANISSLTVSTINGVPHANYVQNPLTSNLSAFNPSTAIFYNITDAGTISANDVRTNNIGIPAGSLATEISVDDSLLIENTKKISFVGDGLIDAGLGLPMKIEATHISTNAIHVSSILNKNLYSEVGVISSLTVSTLLGVDLGGGFTQSTITNNVSYPDGQTYYDASYNIFANQAPYANEPPLRPLPVPYTGTVRNIANTTDLINAISVGTTGDRFLVTADFVLSSPQTIPYGVEFTSDTGSRTISFANANQVALTFSGDNNFFHDVNVTHAGTGSVDSCLSFTSLTATNNFVDSSILTTNEFSIITFNNQIQITNNDIRFTGTADSHRYIGVYGTLGTTIISNNTFAGNGAGSTQCITLLVRSGGSPADYNNGKFVITNNSSVTNPVQRLVMVEANLTGTNSEFWFMRNTATTTSGFVIFFSNPLAGIANIYASDNVETLAPAITGGKGIVGLDIASGTYVLPLNNADPVVRMSNNTAGVLRSDYNDWTTAQDKGIAYQNTRISAAETKNYSIGFKGSFFLPNSVNSSITTQAVRTDFAKVSTLQVSTMAGFSPITFLSSIKMNNNDITGINTLSTTTVDVANLVVSSINGINTNGGLIPKDIGVSSITTSTITFDTLGGINGNVNVLDSTNTAVFSFDTIGRTITASNTSGDITIISPTSISVSDGLIQSEITPGMITAEQLTLINPNSNATGSVLYYNTGTSEVSYGDVPTASVGAELFTSSIVASTLTTQGFVRVSNSPNIINQMDLSGMTYYNDVSGLRLVSLNPQQFQVLSGSNYTMNVSDDFTITTGTLSLENNIAGSLKMPNIPSASNANVLYYDTSTKAVSYGATPGGGGSIPADLTISSLQAVSTLAVSTFTSSMTSFFTSTNQLRANDLTVQQGVLAGMTIAGNNITANGVAPAGGIVSGRLFQGFSTIMNSGSISSLTVSSINGQTPGGGGSTTGVIIALGSTTGLGTNTLTNLGWTVPFIQNTIPGFTYATSGGTANYFTNNTASSITVNVSANIRMLVAANTTGGMRLNIINRSDVTPIFQDVLAWDYQTVPSLTTAREHSFQVEAVFICGAGQRWAIQVQTDINSGAGTPALQASRLNVLTVN